MVEDRVTDGKRIGQLLASELSGLEWGTLGRLQVVDADRDAEPTPGGTFAYGITLDGDRIADVSIHETGARIEITVEERVSDEPADDTHETDGVAVEATGDEHHIHVEYAGAVKRAVDLLVTFIEEGGSDE